MKKVTLGMLVFLLLLCLTGCGSCSVQYELNGGTVVSGDLLQEIPRGGDAVEPVVEREGYRLTGWSQPSEGIRRNAIIYAQWEKAYRIAFDPGDGSLSDPDKAVQYLLKGETPETPDAVMENMVLTGWSPEVEAASRDVTYTAQWEPKIMDSKDVHKKVAPSIVEIGIFNKDGDKEALGSGFFMNDSDTVVTNYHVVGGAYKIEVTTADNNVYDVSSVLGYDETLDLALLDVRTSGSSFLTTASASPETGETVYAIGSSRGQTGTFTNGIVSKESYAIDESDVNYIQHTAPISNGNSGGPLVNTYGEVIGVNTLILKDAQNMNFAVSITELEKLDTSHPLSMREFYKKTNLIEIWGELVTDFIEPASALEEEGNDHWLLADPLALGNWTAGQINSETDVDWFYVQIPSPRRVVFEVVPIQPEDAEELTAHAGVYSAEEEDVELFKEELKNSAAYSYNFEKAYMFEADEEGIYFIEILHDKKSAFDESKPYVYLVRAS